MSCRAQQASIWLSAVNAVGNMTSIVRTALDQAKPAPATKKQAVTAKKRAAKSKKSKAAQEVAQTKLPPAKLDLSLPSDMVRHLQPIGTVSKPRSVPLLPPMFAEKPTDNSAFQINGRLLTNEMQLQLRNEERRDVEGAALEFQFNQ
ncbi:translation initiation factor 2 [Pseudomonas fluorescens ABAC62]|nr:translation initiation factor 2 [Pseudomonas fluorescens ABAC62]